MNKPVPERTSRTGSWAPLLVRIPGQEPQPVGILLVDAANDQLHLRLLEQLNTADSDLLLLWEGMETELAQMARDFGGRGVLQWLAEDASHVFSIGSHREIVMQSADLVIDRLFHRYVVALAHRREAETTVWPAPKFSQADVLDACRKLPGSPTATLQMLAELKQTHVNFVKLEKFVQQDPSLAAHLLRFANSALFYAGGEIRTITQAIFHVGLDRAVRHLSALVLKPFFRSPELHAVWNHSLSAAQVNRQLAGICGYPEPDELWLLGLVHDLGQIVLHSLGERYRQAFLPLRKQGHCGVAIERRLLGQSHAEVGADLLAAWSFPKDMVEAVCYHHMPSQSKRPLTSILYLAESWLESGEDILNLVDHQQALDALHIKHQDLTALTALLDPDLALLRFAA